jgi:hypothetical protein
MQAPIRFRCTKIEVHPVQKGTSGHVTLTRTKPDLRFVLEGIETSAFKVDAEYDLTIMINPVPVIAAPSEEALLALAKGAAGQARQEPRGPKAT